jgi:hypothetical protein
MKKADPERPLPRPSAEYAAGGGPIDFSDATEAKVRGIICNPVYAGIGPFPALVSDETWIRSAAKLIREEGPEQFLVNMLYLARRSFEALMVHEANGGSDGKT